MDSPLPCLPIEEWGPMVILRWSAMQRTGQISSSLCTLFQLCFGPYRWRCPKWFLIHVLMMRQVVVSFCWLAMTVTIRLYQAVSQRLLIRVKTSAILCELILIDDSALFLVKPQWIPQCTVLKSGNKLNAKLDAHFGAAFLNTCSPRLAQALIFWKTDLEGPRCSWLVDAGWDCLFILCIHSCPGMPWLKIGEWLLLLLELGLCEI